MQHSKFPCSGCGACCRRAQSIIESAQAASPGLEFPYGFTESGACEMLGDDNKCKVYDTRPYICSIDQIAETMGFDKLTLYRANAAICNTWIEEDEMDESFKVKI